MLHRIAASLAVLALAACAAQSPPRTDPLADLVGNAKISDAPSRTVAEAKSKTLGLIVSTSAETQIKHIEEMQKKYLEGYVKTYEPRSYGPVKAQYDTVAPRALIETTILELRSRFKSVEVVGDLREFRERKLDVAAVVDLGMEYNASSSPVKNAAEYTTDVTLHFFDRQIRRIGVASGKATEYGERDNSGDFAKGFLLFAPTPKPEDTMAPLIQAEQKSRASAFVKLRESLDGMVQK